MTNFQRSTSVRNIASGIVAAMLLNGCLLSEEETNFSGGRGTDIELSGSVGDGPVVGADLRVLDSSGDTIATFQSNANANYNITISTSDQSYPLTIETSGGIDLVTGVAPDFDMVGALFASGNSTIANVNPFSTFATKLARELPGGLTRENLEDAQEIVTTVLNSGLVGLLVTGPMGTRIDESNIAEIVKASEVLAERVRRSRGLLLAAGFTTSGDQVISVLASDLLDSVIDGVGGNNADRRTAAVSTIVNAQVLLEAMANELRVNGSDATDAMRSAIAQVSTVRPNPTIDGLLATAQMLSQARIGLAAAYSIDADPAILQLHSMVSDMQPGQNATLVRILFPVGYRNVLRNVLAVIASADNATLDRVNAIAGSNGDIDAGNLAPSIQGVPATSVSVAAAYSFSPDAADVNGDLLVFDIANMPPWASFDVLSGELSGTPLVADVGTYSGIVISVSDGEFSASLAAFSIVVRASNSVPQISGTAPASVNAGDNYSFTPSASDADGDALTFSVSGLPSWAIFDTTTGHISGTPADTDIGVYSNISIGVSDGQVSASLSPFSIAVQAVSPGSVTLSWIAPTQNEDGTALTDLAGYRIYWGTTPGNYPGSVTINNISVNTYVVDNLSPGTYDFVATSFNTSGVESRYSDVATKVVP